MLTLFMSMCMCYGVGNSYPCLCSCVRVSGRVMLPLFMFMCMYRGVNVTFDHVKLDVFRGGANVASVHLHVYVLGQGQCCSPDHIHIVFVFS